ncbi:sugar ABC transporter permease [Paenibacillus sp. P25]|nr:sugar ABC transporter permease [Paenibacillus sp. P25]
MSLVEKNLPLPAARSGRKAVKAQSLRSVKWREHLLAYFFLAPSLLLFGIFLFYPMLKSVYLSFQLTDPRGRVAAFAGWDNYIELFSSDKFYQSLKVTLSFTPLTVPAGILIALVLAALTHNKLRGMRLFQFAFSAPVAVSVGTGSIIWMVLFHPTLGTLNYFMKLIGFEPVRWLADPAWALLSVSLMTIWMSLGFNYIVLLSGLQGVPEDIYESAKIDGSGPLRTFFRLTVAACIAYALFCRHRIGDRRLSIVRTDPYPDQGRTDEYDGRHRLQYLSGRVRQFPLRHRRAQALVLFAVILILTVVQFRFFEKKVHYQ